VNAGGCHYHGLIILVFYHVGGHTLAQVGGGGYGTRLSERVLWTLLDQACLIRGVDRVGHRVTLVAPLELMHQGQGL
jgi:hypothetical protein